MELMVPRMRSLMYLLLTTTLSDIFAAANCCTANCKVCDEDRCTCSETVTVTGKPPDQLVGAWEASSALAVVMGSIGGVCMCLPLCGLMFMRAENQLLKDFLTAPTDDVRRAQAILKSKWISVSWLARCFGKTHIFGIEFETQSRGYTCSRISAIVQVLSRTYDQHQSGVSIEVAYRVDDEGDFVIVEDAVRRIGKNGNPKLSCFRCFAVTVMCVIFFLGVQVGFVNSFLCTGGSYHGVMAALILVLIGSVFGRYCLFLCCRAASQAVEIETACFEPARSKTWLSVEPGSLERVKTKSSVSSDEKFRPDVAKNIDV